MYSMALKQPESMDECVYFTRRTVGDKGKQMAWVFRGQCPKCKKGRMAKPKNAQGGIAIRATEYVCPACKYTVEKKAYEDTLTCNVIYTCQHCGKSGEATAPFARKSFEGVKAIVFECDSCKKKIGITKKMKEGKKKGVSVPDDDDDF